MHVKIKNCGLRTPEAIDQSILTGASFIGFVHHESSPRHVSIAAMAKLIQHTRGQAKTVAVTVNPSDALLDEIMRDVNPDFIQLHEVASPTRIEALGMRYGKPVITALSVRSEADLTYVAALEEVSAHLLFDAKHPGGGKPFDWKLLAHLALHKHWFLAGGLTPANVAEAIRITHAPMVDVSSGIEDSPGNKSLEKIAAFNAAVLNAKA